MSDFERKLRRLFTLYNVTAPDGFLEWINTVHLDSVKDIIGEDRDLSTYEESTTAKIFLTDYEAYQANYISAQSRNTEHQIQRARAGLVEMPHDYTYESSRGGW